MVEKEKAFHLKKSLSILLVVLILFLVIARIILPSVLLKKTNNYLANFSPNYYLHMNDLDISLLRGAYRFKEVIGKTKNPEKEFIKIKQIDVSIAWREIFKGRILTDVVTENFDFLVIKDIKKLSPPKKESKDIKDTLFPVDVERVDLKNSSIAFEGYQSLDDKGTLTITNINGRITNVTPTPKFPVSFFNVTAKLIDKNALVKFAGAVNQIEHPFSWKLDTEIREFQMNSLNPYLIKHLPLTFTKGTLDLYSEMISEKGIVKGYFKPFLRELKVISSHEKFINAKHFGIEMLTALANLILREQKTKSVATVIDFTYDKKLNFKMGKGISKAIKHGFEQQLSPGIEDRYHLK